MVRLTVGSFTILECYLPYKLTEFFTEHFNGILEDREWANSTPSGPSRAGSSPGRGGLGGRGDTFDPT